MVSEQLPGTFEVADQTERLQFGYWPSYNVPFYERIYNLSGYPAMVQQVGLDMTYQLAPRAMIFRRDGGSLETLADVQRFMRFNNYSHGDPLAPSPMAAIASRGDLDPQQPMPVGAIDAKITSAALVAAGLAASVVNGPTTDNQPPFAFTGPFASYPHNGLPTTFNFSYVTI